MHEPLNSKVAAMAVLAIAASALLLGTGCRAEYWPWLRRQSCTTLAFLPLPAALAGTVLNQRGLAEQQLDHLQVALSDFKAAVALAPGHERAHNNLGNTYRTLGRHADAEAAYSMAIALEPLHGRVWLNRALTRVGLDRQSAALEDLDRAIELQPKAASPLIARGNVFLRLGHAPLALADYDRAMIVAPENAIWLLEGRACIRGAMGLKASAALDAAWAGCGSKRSSAEDVGASCNLWRRFAVHHGRLRGSSSVDLVVPKDILLPVRCTHSRKQKGA